MLSSLLLIHQLSVHKTNLTLEPLKHQPLQIAKEKHGKALHILKEKKQKITCELIHRRRQNP
jgi:hypothetical protein